MTDVSELRPHRMPAAGTKAYARSSVSNGTKLLPGIDQRSPWVRRCKDIIAEHIADLGGAANLSAAERSLVRRAAVLATELERLESKFCAASQGKFTPRLLLLAENSMAMAARYQPGKKDEPNPDYDAGHYAHWLAQSRVALQAVAASEASSADLDATSARVRPCGGSSNRWA
jgi:hypothetical protein